MSLLSALVHDRVFVCSSLSKYLLMDYSWNRRLVLRSESHNGARRAYVFEKCEEFGRTALRTDLRKKTPDI